MAYDSIKKMWLAVVITLAVKMTLASLIPMTSDEAYFVLWGRYLDFGYYDHPPMIGWFMFLMGLVGKSALMMRMPAVLVSIFVGLGIYEVLKRYDEQKAALAGLLFMVSPINVLNVLITTDTPLMFFSFLSAAFLHSAVTRNNNLPRYALSGAFLGCAFLSKYFAVLLGISYAVYFIFSPKDRKKALGFAVLFLALAPFVALNVYWNYTHCWANIMFNLFNRNRSEVFSLGKVGIFLACQLYLITPPLVYYFLKKKKELPARVKEMPLAVYGFLYAVPLLAFFALSFKKVIGLHWVFSFYPFLYAGAFVILAGDELRRSVRFMAWFTGAHVLIIAVLLSLPVSLLQNRRDYSTIVIGTKTPAVVRELSRYTGDFTLATPSYADSALLEYHLRRHVIVFGGGSHHARHDDILTNFRELNGWNVLILRSSEPEAGAYDGYFQKVEVKKTVIENAAFYLVLGYGFNYEAYREKMLEPIRQKYYDIPAWLPVSPASCYFLDKYFK